MWWVPLVASLISTGANMYNQNKQLDALKSIQAPNEDDYKLSASEKNKIRQDLLADVNGQNMLTQKNIKQVGAAKRLPSGAIMSALGGANYNAAKGAARVEGDLARTDMIGKTNFAEALSKWQTGQATGMMGMYDQSNRSTQSTLGNLSSLLMLWQGGYFNNNNNTALNGVNGNYYSTPQQGPYGLTKLGFYNGQ